MRRSMKRAKSIGYFVIYLIGIILLVFLVYPVCVLADLYVGVRDALDQSDDAEI